MPSSLGKRYPPTLTCMGYAYRDLNMANNTDTSPWTPFQSLNMNASKVDPDAHCLACLAALPLKGHEFKHKYC